MILALRFELQARFYDSRREVFSGHGKYDRLQVLRIRAYHEASSAIKDHSIAERVVNFLSR